MSRALRLFFIGIFLFFLSYALAEIAYQKIDHWSWIDVVYMVVITVFGVGYGEVHPIESPEMKAWTIAIILTGCCSLFLMTGGFLQFLLQEQFKQIYSQKKMKDSIRKLKDHVIVVGHGRVGTLLVEDLVTAGKEVVIVDIKTDLVSECEKEGIPVIIGDATDEKILLEAGISQASAIAVVLPNDALNVFITLSARDLSEKIEIIARGEKPQTAKKLKQAGADHVVMPANSGAEKIARMILFPDPDSKDNPKNWQSEWKLETEQITIDSTSKLIGKTPTEIESEASFLIVSVNRDGTEHCEVEKMFLEAKDVITKLSRKRGDRIPAISI